MAPCSLTSRAIRLGRSSHRSVARGQPPPPLRKWSIQSGPPQPATARGERTDACAADPFAITRNWVDVGRIRTMPVRPAMAPDVIGDLPERCESSLLARIIEDPAIRLAHEGAFA